LDLHHSQFVSDASSRSKTEGEKRVRRKGGAQPSLWFELLRVSAPYLLVEVDTVDVGLHVRPSLDRYSTHYRIPRAPATGSTGSKWVNSQRFLYYGVEIWKLSEFSPV
ncbi:hypothetical protein PMAYCL1PPCAC_28515, partial [Pristionchus mayeri]